MPDYPDRYIDLLPEDGTMSSQIIKISPLSSTDALNQNENPAKDESTTDTPYEGTTTKTTMEQARGIPREGKITKDTPNTDSIHENIDGQVVTSETRRKCDCPSRRRRKRQTNNPREISPCSVKSCPKCKKRLSRIDKVKCNTKPQPVVDPMPACNANNCQDELPPIIAQKKEEPPIVVEQKIEQPRSLDPKPKCDTCMYRRSIECWEPLKGPLYCPKCQTFESPLLRTKTKKTKSYFDSTCLANCWPLCFLPCLLSSPPQHFLHCAECFKFLGTYDECNRCIRPNRDYIDCDGCFSAEASKRRVRLETEQKYKEYLTC